ncbi:MAG TPA: prenyltransferase/squalene oxidase repeat-containing protein [Candidatus Paceibacterota bacterium]|nr:prenyltransferase/squalene oxidase repeat-containing protein [Verrucomicrobiota bacterium]HRZ99630.1 prenyltransferase/squalene oxidase repeat-containing protein [Candidatus Paceibacterota bacterium]
MIAAGDNNRAMNLTEDLRQAKKNLRMRLQATFDPRGFWPGRLSSSALSTAVALLALARINRDEHRIGIESGMHWLSGHANSDGGWGDTPESPSNLSTTLLAWSVLSSLAQKEADSVISRAVSWLSARMGNLEPASIQNALLRIYGKDRTFSVPILTVCALTGRFGAEPGAWTWVPRLPFELSRMPRFLFRWLDLQVVSYALPALIAIGLVRHKSGPPAHHPQHLLRDLITPGALKLLTQIQPSTGGFLEAIPLTAFVVMSLAASNYREHPVCEKGVAFLQAAQRPDGSWAIDSNLATWLTTLTLNHALADIDLNAVLSPEQQARILSWLLVQQHTRTHPFTQAAPGGWAWTDLAGGVPDADDTAGAVLALHRLGSDNLSNLTSAQAGLRWLFDLQNRDGGMPTFCRGWGKLPFDRSCPDITAHALLAAETWRPHLPDSWQKPLNKFRQCGLGYLRDAQNKDGSWAPLWFGNQRAPGQQNLTYGTAQVLIALEKIHPRDSAQFQTMRARAMSWLFSAQQSEGSWGGHLTTAGSVEETSLALSALISAGNVRHPSVQRGFQWLLKTTRKGTVLSQAPVGLYFASLWYDEELYPLIFALGAIHRAARALA